MDIADDQAYKLFNDNIGIINSASSKNEADTRFRAIDTIMVDVLMWDKADINTEEYCRTGFADYVFYANGKKMMVLEAKASGRAFVLPKKSIPSERPILFGLLRQEMPAVAKAFDQAQYYAARIGCRYVAISNGHQWVIGLSFVEDQDSDDRLVYVFSSIEDIKKRFSLFFKCFAPDSLRKNTIYQELSNQPTLPPPAKAHEKIIGYPRPANRNTFKNELTRLIALVWSDIESMQSESEFLEECYCDPGANEDVFESIKAIIDKHNQRMLTGTSHSKTETERKTLPRTGAIDIASAREGIKNIINRYRSEFPYIILGRIGHGKTTFIRNFRHVSSSKELLNYMQIDINFLDRPNRAEEVSQYVYQSIEEQLLRNYNIDIHENSFVRATLNSLINRFSRSPEASVFCKESIEYKQKELEFINQTRNDKHQYYKYVFAHLKGSMNRSIVIFLDNLDRRDADSMQENAFLLAFGIARDWSSLVFITLRPGTFYHSLQESVLDTVAPQVLAISPPRVDLLLEKRFKYSKRIALGQKDFFENTKNGISLILPSVSTFLDCCIESMSFDSKIVRLLASACNGNMRELLNFVKNILTGGHLDTREILNKYSVDNTYRIPAHHIMRSLLYGDSMDYSPGESIFTNLFDINHRKENLHFCAPLMLNFLSRAPHDNHHRGFRQLNEIHALLFGTGFLPNEIDDVFEKLLRAKCIEGEYPGASFTYKSDVVRITSLGDYHIKELMTSFSYIDAIVTDTPIINDEIRNKIEVGDLSIFQRIERARDFVSYLIDCANNSGEGEIIKMWNEYAQLITQDISQVITSAQRNPKIRVRSQR